MKMKYIPQTVLFLLLTVMERCFAWLLPQKRTAMHLSISLQEASQSNAREEVEGRNEKLPISGKPFVIEDWQKQQLEQAHWMSQENQHHYYNNDNVKNTHQAATFWKSHDQNKEPPALRMQELQDEVDYWKDKFDQMRFRLVRERRRHKQHMLELKQQMKQLEDKLEKSNN